MCLQPQLCLITEFAPFGSLSDVLGSTAHVDDLPADNLLKMCFQIAAGMHFLHTRRPKIIHRDLNTNNVLVYALEYELLNVKIADFGLSKEVVKDTSMTGEGTGMHNRRRCSGVQRCPKTHTSYVHRHVLLVHWVGCFVSIDRVPGFAILHCARDLDRLGVVQ